MPAIRYQLNRQYVVLESNNLPTDPMLIPAFLKDGSLIYYPFGGFMTRQTLNHEQTVHLTDINGFLSGTNITSSWRDVSKETLLGAFIKGAYFVVLNHGQPIITSKRPH
ncbi:hypothetical protein LRP50_03810 [Enterovibrio sp. ZSDZ42]|uniref:Uncharacterized protein n=1 Tax=Enterovibrio gelatinilyticus TaxID=2899819 RepID=A0ABT5QW40_9GAMM|nr:hypothetical protein [Enterovibrio sp. ZSDZ42]MDD1792248.1 hypothetical protein [Enterovibrio sp. ZSDZ42]